MNIQYKRALCALALWSIGTGSSMAGEDVLEKSFAVEPGGKLVMKVDRGSIHVTPSQTDKVEVKVVREVRGASASKAAEVIQQHKIDMAESDNTVTIVAEKPSKKLWSFKDPFNRLRVDYTISVPARFNLQLKTAGGNIDVSDLEGTVDVDTSGGNLKLGSIEGPVNAHTSGGNILVEGSKGDVKVHTSGGNLKLGQIEGNLTAKTSGGNISIDQVKGSVDAQTSGGHIEVKSASGQVSARTSGGNVSAQLTQQPESDSQLRTSGGHVELSMPADLAVNLEAQTGGGRIASDFAGDMNKQKTKLTANINGGGPSIVLATSGGNVTIRQK